MDVVKVMDVNLSNKIAAGEVVEKLMNVVKELAENSIDAKAKNIKIELIDSGIKSIKVIDDGCGMDKHDAILCLERHATSKIYDDDDLFNINTLGFRGEAIPSIASVSRFTLKTSDGIEGTTVYIEGGKILDTANSDLRRGTEITVCDIFFNTPARLKYLKSLYSELSNIVSYVNKMALANPDIKFTLINNDKVLLSTDGSGNLLKVISNIYGINLAKKMVALSTFNDDFIVKGYISYPEMAKTSKNEITILINGRNVRNMTINKAIVEAYHTYIPKEKYPIVVLNINCDTSLVDVNVHPTKMDVKISKIDALVNLILDAINETLHKLTLIPEVKYEDRPIANIGSVKTVDDKIDFKENIDSFEKPKFEDLSFDFTYDVKEDALEYKKTLEQDDFIETENGMVLPSKENNSKYKFKKVTPLAVIHATYIVCENEDGMYLMDQHAVNERVNYEYCRKMMGQKTNEKVDLIVPIKLEFSNKEYLILKKHFDILEELGFDFEEFGNNTIIIRSHPAWISKKFAKDLIDKIMEVIINFEHFDKEKFYDRVSATMACKMSIKANQYVSLGELAILIERLRKCDNPFTCPHGRPTIISYTNYEIEKLFKRVMN